jgi:hypothetical protein
MAVGGGAVAAPEQGPDLEAWFPRLRVGMWVKAEGQRAADGVLHAARIKVYGAELDEVAVSSQVAAVDLVGMKIETAVGVRVVATASTELEGPGPRGHLTLAVLEIGDRVKIEGRLQKDGTLLAQEIDIDKAKRPALDPQGGKKHQLTAAIESIDAAGRRIVLLGVPVQLSEQTRIRSPLPD